LIKLSKKIRKKLIVFSILFFICLMLSFTVKGFLFFRTIDFFPVHWIFLGDNSLLTIFFRWLFGPITPLVWRIGSLFNWIDNYGLLRGGKLWFSDSKIDVFQYLTYIFIYFYTIRHYFKESTRWNNWWILVILGILSLIWPMWGESHFAFGA